MKKKYILQIKRRYFWEDLISFNDERQAKVSCWKLLSDNIECRIIEVWHI